MGIKLLIIGGTGSFGSKYVEIALRENRYETIRVFSRGEDLQVKMEQKYGGDSRLRFLIGDVRDASRLKMAMDGVDIVVNAAALKHIPVGEYNPEEFVKTNIMGAINVIHSAIYAGVSKIINISTDKSAYAVNLYGGTKFVAERLFIQANVYASAKDTKFSCVRYGNVLASRGSILPLFLKQKENGEVTITDNRMTRFWITLEQGVYFVMDRLDDMQGGEVFVPKLPSMKVLDIAEVIAPNIPQRVTGIRPGEKLHEVLITEEESHHTMELEKHFVIVPEFPYWRDKQPDVGGKQAEIMTYASNTNKWWLTEDELKCLIGI
ncbi:hypothetical protein LCGC14_1418950 [marine sediment metagenome]|uniref:Polysaccharide biosynthesis protein CapD-like domain-containing protein n=1 Tax=marine sediment metagenome TaxID=412755 RepID=A0A0F9JSC7_9ZZZZ